MFLFTAGILPTVTKPTRITHTSTTVIDNLYIKCQDYGNIHSRIIMSDISDHFPIISFIGEMVKPDKKAPLIFNHRPIDTVQINRLPETLRTTDW